MIREARDAPRGPADSGLWFDVFGAVGQRFRQRSQMAIENAGCGEVDDLLELRWIEQLQHPLHRRLHLLGPLRLPPGGCGVNHPGHRRQLRREAIGVAQISHQQPNPWMIGANGGELGRIPQPEEQLRVGALKQPARDVLSNAAAGSGDQDPAQAAAPMRSITDLPASKKARPFSSGVPGRMPDRG